MITASHSRHQRLLRITGFALLVFILLWLPIENSTLHWPVFLGLLCGVWLGTFLDFRLDDQFSLKPWYAPLVATFSGGAVPVFVIFLMLIKNGAHSHGTPDYSLIELFNVLWRIPYYVMGGCLIGVGIMMYAKYSTR